VAQEVPGRLRPRIFLTFRHYMGGRSSAKRTGRLYPRRNPWYSLSEAESTSGHMVLSGEPQKKSPVTPSGIDPETVRLVAQRLNHYAIPGPSLLNTHTNIFLDFTFAMGCRPEGALIVCRIGRCGVLAALQTYRSFNSCYELFCIKRICWWIY